MARISCFIHLTLDGVMESPEDWVTPYDDKVLQDVIGLGMKKAPDMLFGHTTYDQFYSFWPPQKDNPFTDVLNKRQKFVTSRRHAALPWESSTLLEGEAARTVAALKAKHDRDLLVLGSGELMQALFAANLVDEMLLTINPLVLGQGQKLFPEGAAPGKLQLVDSKISTKGVVIATYRPAR